MTTSTRSRSRRADEFEARSVRIELATDLDRVPPVEGHMGALREAVTNLLIKPFRLERVISVVTDALRLRHAG